MTRQQAEHYRGRISTQITALQTRISELKGAADALENEKMWPFLDEERILRVIGRAFDGLRRRAIDVVSGSAAETTPAPIGAPATAPVRYRMPNRGLRAQITRYLMSGPATEQDLFEAVKVDNRKSFDDAVDTAIEISIVARAGNTLTLTDKGRVQGEWLMAHPTAKLYAPQVYKG